MEEKTQKPEVPHRIQKTCWENHVSISQIVSVVTVLDSCPQDGDCAEKGTESCKVCVNGPLPSMLVGKWGR